MTDEQVYIYNWIQAESWHPYPVRVHIYWNAVDTELLNFFVPPYTGDRIGMHNWIAPPEMPFVLEVLIPRVEIEPDTRHEVRSMRMPHSDDYRLRIFIDCPGDVDEMLDKQYSLYYE